MHFHSDFWVAMATVAPLLALAAILVLADANSSMWDYVAREKRLEQLTTAPAGAVSAASRGMTVARLAKALATTTMVVQAAVLWQAFQCLATDNDHGSLTWTMRADYGGILLLAIASTLGALLRAHGGKLDAEIADLEAAAASRRTTRRTPAWVGYRPRPKSMRFARGTQPHEREIRRAREATSR